jgi:hypothetical protein
MSSGDELMCVEVTAVTGATPSRRGEKVCLVRLVEAMHGWRHSSLQPLPLLSGRCNL